MGMYLKVISFGAIGFLIIAIGSWAGEIRITNEQAIAIASRAVMQFGYDSKDMNVQITFHKKPWNKILPRNCVSGYDRTRQNKLKGKSYWSVYYHQRPSSEGGLEKGGDACIFIDSETGEVLTSYGGE